MSLRTTLTATAAAVVLLAAAGATIAVTSNSSSADSSESTTTASAATDRATYGAGAAGTVTVVNDGGVLRFAAISPADGWRSDIEVPRGREIEVNFTNDGRRVDFNAELEDGQIRVRVRDSAASTSEDSLADVVTVPADPPTDQPSPSGNVHSVAADGAGVVDYTFDGSLTVTSVHTARMWAAEIEQERGDEIEVVFTTSNGSRIDVEVEIEDGAPRERVRTRDDDRDDRDDDDFRRDDRDDNDDRHDDNDDRHDGDDRHGGDDRSGHGGGDHDDDHHGDDDNSGHGGGDDDNSGHGGGDD